MAVGQVTEQYHYRCGKHLRKYRVHVRSFNQYFKQNVIEHKIKHTDHKITEKLDAAFHTGIAEYNIFRHKETDWESDAKRNEQGGNMRFECIEAKIELLFP